LKSGVGIHQAIPPVNSQHTLAPVFLGEVQIFRSTMHVELREPHRRVVFQPRNRPPFALAKFSVFLAHPVPAQIVIERSENNIPRQMLVKIRKVPNHSAPARYNQMLIRSMAFEEIVGLQVRRYRQRNAFLLAGPVHRFVFPQPDVIDRWVDFQQMSQPCLKDVFAATDSGSMRGPGTFGFLLLEWASGGVARKISSGIW